MWLQQAARICQSIVLVVYFYQGAWQTIHQPLCSSMYFVAARPDFWISSIPDGKMLASGSVDRTIRLWDIGRKKQVDVLEGHIAWAQVRQWV